MNMCEGLNRPNTGKNDNDDVQNNKITFKLRLISKGLIKYHTMSGRMTFNELLTLLCSCTDILTVGYFILKPMTAMISAAGPESTTNHCPLCHCNIPPYEDGWRQHLMGLPCPNHPRKKHLKNRK
jgi:hypothetical protein